MIAVISGLWDPNAPDPEVHREADGELDVVDLQDLEHVQVDGDVNSSDVVERNFELVVLDRQTVGLGALQPGLVDGPGQVAEQDQG